MAENRFCFPDSLMARPLPSAPPLIQALPGIASCGEYSHV